MAYNDSYSNDGSSGVPDRIGIRNSQRNSDIFSLNPDVSSSRSATGREGSSRRHNYHASNIFHQDAGSFASNASTPVRGQKGSGSSGRDTVASRSDAYAAPSTRGVDHMASHIFDEPEAPSPLRNASGRKPVLVPPYAVKPAAPSAYHPSSSSAKRRSPGASAASGMNQGIMSPPMTTAAAVAAAAYEEDRHAAAAAEDSYASIERNGFGDALDHPPSRQQGYGGGNGGGAYHPRDDGEYQYQQQQQHHYHHRSAADSPQAAGAATGTAAGVPTSATRWNPITGGPDPTLSSPTSSGAAFAAATVRASPRSSGASASAPFSTSFDPPLPSPPPRRPSAAASAFNVFGGGDDGGGGFFSGGGGGGEQRRGGRRHFGTAKSSVFGGSAGSSLDDGGGYYGREDGPGLAMMASPAVTAEPTLDPTAARAGGLSSSDLHREKYGRGRYTPGRNNNISQIIF